MNSVSSSAVPTTNIRTAIYLKANAVSDTLQIKTAEDIKTITNTTINFNTATRLNIITTSVCVTILIKTATR